MPPVHLKHFYCTSLMPYCLQASPKRALHMLCVHWEGPEWNITRCTNHPQSH